MASDQLPLQMTTRLAYTAENFFLHSGVRAISKKLGEVVTRTGFSFHLVCGASQSGKTHLSLYLSEVAQGQGCYPILIEGEQFADRIPHCVDQASHHKDLVFFVDDAGGYLAKLQPGDSGPLVSFVESCRASRAKLIFFLNDAARGSFRYDEHVGSRLAAAEECNLEPPALKEMPEMIGRLAKQRGVHLTPKKVQYLVSRLGRDIESVVQYLSRLEQLQRVLGKPAKFPVLGDAL